MEPLRSKAHSVHIYCNNGCSDSNNCSADTNANVEIKTNSKSKLYPNDSFPISDVRALQRQIADWDAREDLVS